MNTIDKLQSNINRLFAEYKIPQITRNLPIENLQSWSQKVAKHFELEPDKFTQTVSELFWTTSHVQFSIGYALLAKKDCKSPYGAKGTFMNEKDIPDDFGIAELHFWYHLYNSYECIYRCWERITTVIKYVCYPGNMDKIYFDQLVKKLEGDIKFINNKSLKNLKKQIKHWNRIASIRNKRSHLVTSPHLNIKIEGKASELLGVDGLPIIYLDYVIESPKKSVELIVDKYKKILPAILTMKGFIDSIDR